MTTAAWKRCGGATIGRPSGSATAWLSALDPGNTDVRGNLLAAINGARWT